MFARVSSQFTVSILLVVWAQSSLYLVHADENQARQHRRPVALVPVNEDRQIAIANSRSGTVTLVDLQQQKVVSETNVGKRLSDIITTTDPQRLLTTDEESHELIAIRLAPDGCSVEKRLTVSPYPVSVRIDGEGTRAYVASLWSRTITVVDLAAWLSNAESGNDIILHQFRLPFAPRVQLVVDINDLQKRIPSRNQRSLRLVVADAFGSKLAVVDPESGQICSIREIPAHAIRAMQLHPTRPRLLLTHQMLSRSAQTSFDDVHWGNLMVNCLRSLDLVDVLEPKADLLNKSNLDFLGGPEHGAADPAGFAFKPNGSVVVAISGTDELIDDDGTHMYPRRSKVGNGPTAVVTASNGEHAFVANTLGDSVTVFTLKHPTVIATISLGPHPEATAVDRGERLFRSAKLSHDNWISCSSCHVDGHSNGQFNDNQTDGSIGTAKRVLSLRGIADTAPYAWNGRFATLAEQIGNSVHSTMHGESLSDEQMNELEAYLRTLSPAPAVGSRDKQSLQRGEALFEKLDCRHCHAPPALTSPQIVDVKLKDERGQSDFNPPSLRGVSQNGPYFHDGRAESLEAVFKKFHHQIDREVSDDQLVDLVAFLNSL